MMWNRPSGVVRQIGFALAVTGMVFGFGFGGCSMKSIAAGLLSEALTTGGGTAGLTSGLGSLMTDLINMDAPTSTGESAAETQDSDTQAPETQEPA